MTAAIRSALNEVAAGSPVGAAQHQLAIAMARLVDAGSVPAARELRGVLADLADREDEETQQFIESIRVPRPI